MPSDAPPKLQVFVASPGDVRQEREVCRKLLAELQRDRLRMQHLRIASFFWEDDSIPGVGADAQAVVNESFAVASRERYVFRIVVCIVRARLGTKTRFAQSGTIEEVVRALLNATADRGRLLLYVSDRPLPPSGIDAAQLNGVKCFLEAFRLAGGLACSISSVKQFETEIRQHLREAIDRCISEVEAPAGSQVAHTTLPFAVGDNLIDYARSLFGELQRLSALAASNFKKCFALLSACADLATACATTDLQAGADVAANRLRAFQDDAQGGLAYVPLLSGVEALKSAKILIAFRRLLNDELQLLCAEIATECGRLLQSLKPLIETAVDFCNLVLTQWPAAHGPIEDGSVLARIRADLDPLRALESEAQGLESMLGRSAAAAYPSL